MSTSKPPKIFFFDSDVLIAAKNHYYNPAYAEIFWGWLLDGVNDGIFRTATNIRSELLAGDEDDFLRLVAQDEKFDEFWCETNTQEVGAAFGKLQNWANTEWVAGKDSRENAPLLRNALATFAAGKIADPWLVALASHMQSAKKIKAYIVTNEKSEPQAIRRVMLPDAAKSQNVEAIKLFEVLKQHSGMNFKYRGQI